MKEMEQREDERLMSKTKKKDRAIAVRNQYHEKWTDGNRGTMWRKSEGGNSEWMSHPLLWIKVLVADTAVQDEEKVWRMEGKKREGRKKRSVKQREGKKRREQQSQCDCFGNTEVK